MVSMGLIVVTSRPLRKMDAAPQVSVLCRPSVCRYPAALVSRWYALTALTRTAVSGRLSSVDRNACASASASPMSTKGAIRPALRSSLGPLGQSVLTTGIPSAIASVNVLGDPSHREDKTNTDARLIQAQGLA